jgi:hypothetical protein
VTKNCEIVLALRERQLEPAIRILSEHIQIRRQARGEAFDSWNRGRAMRHQLPPALRVVA